MPIRTYADTSVYGGLHNPAFTEASYVFFDQVRAGRFTLITSAVVAEELAAAPEKVQADLEAMLPDTEVVDITPEALDLQQAYF